MYVPTFMGISKLECLVIVPRPLGALTQDGHAYIRNCPICDAHMQVSM